MNFNHPGYDDFFSDLLCQEGEDLSKYSVLFDLRKPILKRKEFIKIYRKIWMDLERSGGRICQLQLGPNCEINNPVHIDHVIPLSSNVLNKSIRNSKPLQLGKKVTTESFGSNNILNLVLACRSCNLNKKHRFLKRDQMQRILRFKGF